jgi:hypothetical protein
MGAFGNSTLNDLSGFFLKISSLSSEKSHSDRSECGCRTHPLSPFAWGIDDDDDAFYFWHAVLPFFGFCGDFGGIS